MKPSTAHRYIIRANARQDGVTLSLCGHWGNLPYPDADAARKAAGEHAGGQTFMVERQGC